MAMIIRMLNQGLKDRNISKEIFALYKIKTRNLDKVVIHGIMKMK